MHQIQKSAFRIASACVLLAVVLKAQPAPDAPVPFFHSPRIALLFQLNGYGLDRYESGIGAGFRQSDDFYWRFSLAFSASQYDYDSEKSVGGWSNTRTNASLGLFASPLLLLFQQDPGFVGFSPCAGIGYTMVSDENTSTDSLGTHMRSDSNDKWTLLAGCSVVGGIALTKRLLLSAEYRIYIRRELSAADLSYDGSNMVPMSSGSTRLFSLGTSAILTLYYSL